jgi:hypothetical protein
MDGPKDLIHVILCDLSSPIYDQLIDRAPSVRQIANMKIAFILHGKELSTYIELKSNDGKFRFINVNRMHVNLPLVTIWQTGLPMQRFSIDSPKEYDELLAYRFSFDRIKFDISDKSINDVCQVVCNSELINCIDRSKCKIKRI